MPAPNRLKRDSLRPVNHFFYGGNGGLYSTTSTLDLMMAKDDATEAIEGEYSIQTRQLKRTQAAAPGRDSAYGSKGLGEPVSRGPRKPNL